MSRCPRPRILFAALLWMCSACALAQPATLRLGELAAGQRVEGHLAHLRDPSGQLTLDDVRQREFEPLPAQAGFGFTSDAIWLRLQLEAPEAGEWWLEAGLSSLDDIRVYHQDARGVWQMRQAGDHLPFGARGLPHRLFVFPIWLPANEARPVYLRIRTADSLTVPLRLWSPARFHDYRAYENLVLGLGYGIVLAMLIYNGFLWLALRESLYGAYLLATLTILLVVAELNGHAFQYLWPDNLWMADYQHVLLPAIQFIAQSHWLRSFLDTRRRTPWLDRGFLLIMLAAAGMIGLALAGQYTLGNQLAFVIGLPFIVLSILTSARIVWLGHRPARIFLVAQLFPLVGAMVTLLRALGMLPDSPFSEHAIQIGVSVEVLLFSLALAQRIEVLRQERHEALTLAHTDPLTGLFNRPGFLQRLDEQLACDPAPVALLLVDLDRFKPVNDTYGHAMGDAVLQVVATRLHQNVRPGTDLVGRLGGDEFVVALCGPHAGDAAETVADQIIASLGEPIDTLGQRIHIGASIGIALARQHRGDALTLIAAADAAMYQAKHGGRNRHAWATLSSSH